jgi:hypothetical protein
MLELASKFLLHGGSGLVIRLLCVPSMGENQKRFKSSVYRMNIDKMKRTTRSQLRKGDRPWGGRLWESHQATNSNLIRGRRNGTSWHNTAKFLHSVPEVNEALGWWRFSSLPGEISSTCGRESGSVLRSNAWGDGREVSRGHITETMNRGTERRPFKLRNSQAQLRMRSKYLPHANAMR